MKKFNMTRIAAVCLLAGGVNSVVAAEPAKISSEDLLNILIQEGVVDEKKVNEVVKKAQEKTAKAVSVWGGVGAGRQGRYPARAGWRRRARALRAAIHSGRHS